MYYFCPLQQKSKYEHLPHFDLSRVGGQLSSEIISVAY